MANINIELERVRLQKTKEEFSEMLGITSKTYLGYIRGVSIPSKILVKLREITGKSIDYLLGMEE